MCIRDSVYFAYNEWSAKDFNITQSAFFATEENATEGTNVEIGKETSFNEFGFIKVRYEFESKQELNGKILKFTKDYTDVYKRQTKMLVEERLAAAKAVDPNRPIFLFYHIPPADTVLNTDWTTPADAWIKGLLSQYPQAVLFTAHTHFSVRHPRQIDQTIATVVNGGAGTYVCVPDTDASGRAYDNADDNVPMNGDIADDTAAVSYTHLFPKISIRKTATGTEKICMHISESFLTERACVTFSESENVGLRMKRI